MLEFVINAESIDESNFFLRKLWCELGSICPMTWQHQPSRSGSRISIGHSNLGEISFDYKRKGCIRKLYIDNNDKSLSDKIEAAVCRAREGKLKTLNTYTHVLPSMERAAVETLDSVIFNTPPAGAAK